jgi:hypothetical protein
MLIFIYEAFSLCKSIIPTSSSVGKWSYIMASVLLSRWSGGLSSIEMRCHSTGLMLHDYTDHSGWVLKGMKPVELLGSWVRIPLEAFVPVCVVLCRKWSCVGLILLRESYRLSTWFTISKLIVTGNRPSLYQKLVPRIFLGDEGRTKRKAGNFTADCLDSVGASMSLQGLLQR